MLKLNRAENGYDAQRPSCSFSLSQILCKGSHSHYKPFVVTPSIMKTEVRLHISFEDPAFGYQQRNFLRTIPIYNTHFSKTAILGHQLTSSIVLLQGNCLCEVERVGS
jgi:hypothetical protein